MSVGDNIKNRRKEIGMNAESLAEKVGVSPSTIYRYENGDIEKLDSAKLVPIADVLGVSVAYLLGWSEKRDASDLIAKLPVSNLTRVAVIGAVRCGPGGLAYHDIEGSELADVANPGEYFYLRATGNSMEPRIYEGDYVLVHIQEDVESGELAVVVIDGEEGTLKKVIKKGDAVILQAFNPEYPPRIFTGSEINQLCIVGKVVQLMRKM